MKKYVIGIGEALFDCLPEGSLTASRKDANSVARPQTSLIMSRSSDSTDVLSPLSALTNLVTR